MKNVEASIRARLTQKAKERGITFQYASLLYMQEGLLARIAGSSYARKLILKGGFLLFANQQAAGRTTKDIDFLGDGIPNDPQALAEIFAVLVTREYGDGLSFDVGSIRSERITEVAEYHGVRLHVTERLGTVRNTIQIDVGFGDALEGGPRSTILRKLLDDTPLVIITCCRALEGWREQRGRVRAKAFQEAAFLSLFRKGLDKEVPSSREADIEQPARPFVSFSPRTDNALVPFQIDVIDLKRRGSSARFVFVCQNPMVHSEARNLAKLEYLRDDSSQEAGSRSNAVPLETDTLQLAKLPVRRYPTAVEDVHRRAKCVRKIERTGCNPLSQ